MNKPIDIFSAADKAVIADLARGMTGVLGQALSIHRASMRIHGLRHGDPFFDFMSEVDNPCPDLNLRARYRAAVISRLPQGTAGK